MSSPKYVAVQGEYDALLCQWKEANWGNPGVYYKGYYNIAEYSDLYEAQKHADILNEAEENKNE